MYVAFCRDGETYLTFLQGGPVERDFTVKLAPSGAALIASKPECTEQLMRDLNADLMSLAARVLSQPIWPESEAK
jgi:hypothetical protein